MSDKKNFVLQQNGEDSNIVFANKQPRGAALKAAARGFEDIRLRERGTKRVHVFKGWREQVTSPADRPKWLPAQVWKAKVKKIGVERLK